MSGKRTNQPTGGDRYTKAKAGALDLGLKRPTVECSEEENRRRVAEYTRKNHAVTQAMHKYTMDLRLSPSLGMYKARYEQEYRDLARDGGWRTNLGAIIIPDLHGRSSLAKEFGFINAEDLLSEDEVRGLNAIRTNTILKGSFDWGEHCRAWGAKLNAKLDLIKLERPAVLLCASEEIAMAVRAQPMGTVLLSETAVVQHFRRAEENLVTQGYGRISWTLGHAATVFGRAYHCGSLVDIERVAIALCNVSGVPIGAPWKHSTQHDNDTYDLSCPDWVLRGELEDGDWDELLALHDLGMVPKECVDYFARKYGPCEHSAGFGTTLWDWAVAMGSDTTGVVRWVDWQEGRFTVPEPSVESGVRVAAVGQGQAMPTGLGLHTVITAGPGSNVEGGQAMTVPTWLLTMVATSDTLFHSNISFANKELLCTALRHITLIPDDQVEPESGRGGGWGTPPVLAALGDAQAGGSRQAPSEARPPTQSPRGIRNPGGRPVDWFRRPRPVTDPATPYIRPTPVGMDGGRVWERDVDTAVRFNWVPDGPPWVTQVGVTARSEPCYGIRAKLRLVQVHPGVDVKPPDPTDSTGGGGGAGCGVSRSASFLEQLSSLSVAEGRTREAAEPNSVHSFLSPSGGHRDPGGTESNH